MQCTHFLSQLEKSHSNGEVLHQAEGKVTSKNKSFLSIAMKTVKHRTFGKIVNSGFMTTGLKYNLAVFMYV